MVDQSQDTFKQSPIRELYVTSAIQKLLFIIKNRKYYYYYLICKELSYYSILIRKFRITHPMGVCMCGLGVCARVCACAHACKSVILCMSFRNLMHILFFNLSTCTCLYQKFFIFTFNDIVIII